MKTNRVLATIAALLPLAAGAFPIEPSPPMAVELVNSTTGHYVLIRDPAELGAIDAGAAGAGWKRTGMGFAVNLPTNEIRDGNVCRFYSPIANSHFHTGFADECNLLRNNDLGWLFEKVDFNILMPAYGACEFMHHPVYRLYGRPTGTSNHRYTPFADVRDEMVASGWLYEGVAFCTPSTMRQASKRFVVSSGRLAPTGECEDERIALGACVALNQLPRMPTAINEYLPPSFVVPNPEYPAGAVAVTGSCGQFLFTAASPWSPADVLRRSFLQTNGEAQSFGIHVNSVDRTLGDLASINPLFQFRTTAPAEGAADERVFPWADGRDNRLEISFELAVATLRRNDPSSHAYGHPTLQLIDHTTGQHLYITLGTYGSGAFEGTDYLARDIGTGRVIVSTTFRKDPSFGERLSGESIVCPGFGACEPPATESFRFRIDRAAFRTVLQRARTLAPELSANPSDYLLANFHFNNEVYRDAEVGLRLSGYALEIFER